MFNAMARLRAWLAMRNADQALNMLRTIAAAVMASVGRSKALDQADGHDV